MTSYIENANNYNNWILESFSPFIGNRILEIGTGQGNLKSYLKYSYNIFASIDIDKEVITRAKKRDLNGLYFNLSIIDPDCKDILRPYEFDTVLCLNVLEHIKEPRIAISNMRDIICSGGNLLIFVPAFPFIYNNLDRLAGHYIRYTKHEFIKLIDKEIFKIQKIEYFNFIGGWGWYFNKFLKNKDLDSKSLNNQMKFFDKYLVPVSKIMNPIMKNIFGQSLIAVIKKK